MKPEIRAKKDKCTLVASVDHGKLRVLGASDDPIVVLEGQVLEPRAPAGQVHVVQRECREGYPLDDLMWGRGHIGGPFTLTDHTGKTRTDAVAIQNK